MTTEKIFDEALKNILSEDEILKDEPMKHHTTFRVGGPAEYYLRPKKEQVAEVLRLCLTYQKEYLIIGNGSNLLVSDKGISGVVIEIGKQMDEITVDGTTIYAQAGAMLSKTAHAALEAGLTGMEFAAGIPGCDECRCLRRRDERHFKKCYGTYRGWTGERTDSGRTGHELPP